MYQVLLDLKPQNLVFQFAMESEKLIAAKPKQRSCNRHSDCDAAEAKVLAANPGMQRWQIGFNFHCHDDECEDCFGS